MSAISLEDLHSLKHSGEKIACLTAYDASFAHWLEAGGVEIVLVGDSLGMVIQGHDSTLPVSLEQMVYHAACVARGCTRAYRIVDMPYRTYSTPDQALTNARRLIQGGEAAMVKLEGGFAVQATVQHLVANGVPVCGHLGLLPQSVRELGGYRVQGRDSEAAARILAEAHALEAAGAQLLVLECIPAGLAGRITAQLGIPTIGIGAGADCDGQVLVLYDLLGITPGRRPRFTQDFLQDAGSVGAAIKAYVRAVKQGAFPRPEQSY